MQLLHIASKKCSLFEFTVEVANLPVTVNLFPEKDNPCAYTDVIWVISKLIFIQQNAIEKVLEFLKSPAFLYRKVALFSILYNQSKIRVLESLESVSNLVTEMIHETGFVYEELRETYNNLESIVQKLNPSGATSVRSESNETKVESVGSRIAKFEACKINLSETAREALDGLRASYNDYEDQEKKLSIDIKTLCACCLVALEKYPPKISEIPAKYPRCKT